MFRAKPDYELYKNIGGYLYDEYGDRFFNTVPELHDENFDTPLICIGDYSMAQDTPTKDVLRSRPSITTHLFVSADVGDGRDQLEEIMSRVYAYALGLNLVGEYQVALDTRYTVNSVSLEQEDNLRLLHGTLDLTYRVN
ncbi:hypothetical protein LNP00_06280 [Fructobacillus sp. M158]|uniref:hypothetical protein n=1 Tax=Fructobacillus parabroussonetiae TaxID=2713174 RepID=UPI00200A4F3A|nr:hypothetical protein [Fructobacillus parabroussonetiae]MCK8617959.1 hypothetical protein [Fructobacillus parabroussonetiae]